MKIEKLNKKVVKINNVIYNLGLQKDYNQVKLLLNQKEFTYLTGIVKTKIDEEIKDVINEENEVFELIENKKNKKRKKDAV